MNRKKAADWLTPKGLEQICGLSRQGKNERQIAREIGVPVQTLRDWQCEYPQIAYAMEDGWVEGALLRCARGFSCEERTQQKQWDQKLGKYITTEKVVTREFPPNAEIARFWLENRRPQQWTQDPQDERAAQQENNLFEMIALSRKEAPAGEISAVQPKSDSGDGMVEPD